jgi:hypothetical protein
MEKSICREGGEGALGEEGDEASRLIVVATLNFLRAEISANLMEESPGVASVLALIESLALETQKPLTKGQLEKTKIPARMGAMKATLTHRFVH